jgi:hypothetical protein
MGSMVQIRINQSLPTRTCKLKQNQEPVLVLKEAICDQILQSGAHCSEDRATYSSQANVDIDQCHIAWFNSNLDVPNCRYKLYCKVYYM